MVLPIISMLSRLVETLAWRRWRLARWDGAGPALSRAVLLLLALLLVTVLVLMLLLLLVPVPVPVPVPELLRMVLELLGPVGATGVRGDASSPADGGAKSDDADADGWMVRERRTDGGREARRAPERSGVEEGTTGSSSGVAVIQSAGEDAAAAAPAAPAAEEEAVDPEKRTETSLSLVERRLE